jgi:predicted DsbA family dithiol-disulfide isomerase
VWLERQFGARVAWLPFDLHPEYPPDGIPRADLRARYGEGYDTRTRELFAAEGLVYAPPPDVVSSTRLALELGEGARTEGLHRPYHDRLMDAYWAEGVDLSRRTALEELARDVGVSDAAITRALDERAWRPTVDSSTARAQAAGATGVPAFVIDWRVLVVGAQPRELLAQAVEQARMTA